MSRNKYKDIVISSTTERIFLGYPPQRQTLFYLRIIFKVVVLGNPATIILKVIIYFIVIISKENW